MSAVIDSICEGYLAAWSSSDRPSLDQFLGALPDDERAAALCRLIEIDIRNRKRAGQTPLATDYQLHVAVDDPWLLKLLANTDTDIGSPGPQGTTSITTMTAAHRPETPVTGILPDELPVSIGRYRVVRVIGSGAFGMVLEALDEDLHRRVAVKLPHRKSTDDEAELSLVEARAAAKLSHPGIVGVHDCGRLGDGRFYIVSELVEGETLFQEMQRGLNVRRSVTLMIELADAVHHAHLNGLYHRDLKPRNILIDRSGHPRITDFGLVLDESQQHRFAGQVSGSPAYMSPEQIRGESHFLDGRTDVWSLGVIFHEMLTGRRPFQSPSVAGLFDEIKHREPRPLRQINDSIPRELEAICLKCLKRPLTDRYATAADLAEDLRTWLRSEEQGIASSRNHVVGLTDSAHAHSSSSLTALFTGTGSTTELARAAKRHFLIPLVLMSVAVVTTLAITSGWNSSRRVHAPSTTTPPVPTNDAHATAAGAIPVKSEGPVWSGVLSPDAIPPGLWFPLLDRDPKLLHWPLVPRNSDFSYRGAKREASLTSDQTIMIEFGRTAAPDFSIRTKLHQPNWVGGVGFFWGHQEEETAGQFQYQFVGLQPYRSARKEEPFRLTWEIGHCNGEGWESNRVMLQEFSTSRPGPEACDLQISIRKGLLHQIRWNGADLGEIQCHDPLSQPLAQDAVGALGIVVQKSSALVREPAIQFLK